MSITEDMCFSDINKKCNWLFEMNDRGSRNASCLKCSLSWHDNDKGYERAKRKNHGVASKTKGCTKKTAGQNALSFRPGYTVQHCLNFLSDCLMKVQNYKTMQADIKPLNVTGSTAVHTNDHWSFCCWITLYLQSCCTGKHSNIHPDVATTFTKLMLYLPQLSRTIYSTIWHQVTCMK